MKILNSIETSTPGSVCRNCAYFQNEPARIEEVYPGLTAFSSAFASVRDQDGFCNFNQLYLSARDSCPRFTRGSKDFSGAEG